MVLLALVLNIANARAEEPDHHATVLLLDASASLLQTDPENLRSEAARLFVDLAPDGDKLRIVEFDGEPRELTKNGWVDAGSRADLRAAASGAGRAGEHTDQLAALKAAIYLFEAEGNDFRAKYPPRILLFSDGAYDPAELADIDDSLSKLADRAAQAHITYEGIGLGENARSDMAKFGAAFHGRTVTAEAADLPRVFFEAAEPALGGVRVAYSEGNGSFEPTVPAWATSTMLTFIADDACGDVPTVAGCTVAKGTRYAVSRCNKGKTVRLDGGSCNGKAYFTAFGSVVPVLDVAPSQPMAGEPITVTARVKAGDTVLLGKDVAFLNTATVGVAWNGKTIALYDDGQDGDTVAGDGVYARTWVPEAAGTYPLTLDITGVAYHRSTGRPLTVLDGPVTLSTPGEITCFWPGSCVDTIDVANTRTSDAVGVRCVEGCEATPLTVAGGQRGRFEARLDTPEAGRKEVVFQLEAAQARYRRTVVVHRLSAIEYLAREWVWTGPSAMVLLWLGFTLVRGPRPLRGALKVVERQGTTTSARVEVLDTFGGATLSAQDLGIPGDFTLRNGSRFGHALEVVPGVLPLRLAAQGSSQDAPVVAPFRPQPGDVVRLQRDDRTFSLHFD